MTGDPSISIRNLYKIFGPHPEQLIDAVKAGMSKAELMERHRHVLGLRDINVDMRGGEITVIMGLSGSGKSTLIRHINRLIEPTDGAIRVEGENVLEYGEERLRQMRRAQMAMVFQHFALLPHRTVLENTALAQAVRGAPRARYEEAAHGWLKRVGLDGQAGQYPHQLSGGMQQRVGIARALCSNAPIMLMDEAFSALDPLIRTDMQDLLLELQKELHKTIVFISHDLDEALKLADHLVILKDGVVVQQGEPQEILLYPIDPYIVDFISDINRARVLRVRSIMGRLSEQPPGSVSGEVAPDDTLESVIARAGGEVDCLFRVVQGGVPVGWLDMRALLRSLVPTRAAESGGLRRKV